MADITQADVAVTQTSNDEDYSGQRLNRMWPKIVFGGGSFTYPTYGVPLPDIQQFRLKQFIKRLYIQQPADGFVYRYDPTVRTANPIGPYGTIRIFQGQADAGAVTIADHTNLAIGAPTVANHANITVAAPADHSHGLVIAANTAGTADQLIGANASNNKLVANANGPFTIPGGVAANGGVANGQVPAPANIANLQHSVGAPANMANLTHVVTGGTGVAAPLVELGNVSVAVTTLYLEIIGA